MTVQVERTFEVPAPRERVWAFIADPEKRAGAISVVERFELHDPDGREATWHLSLPIPFVDRTVAVETEDVEREEPEYVKFVGRSSAMRVTGEHRLSPTENGTRVQNRFVVDGRVPGVERFFKRNLEAELGNLKSAIEADLGVEL